MSAIQPKIQFNKSFKLRFGHDKIPYTDLIKVVDIIFEHIGKQNVKRLMGFVEEDTHMHLFLECKDLLCDKKSCEALRKHFYKEIKALENSGQGGQNPITIVPYTKFRKQEYSILSEEGQYNHQINYITKDFKFTNLLKNKFFYYNVTKQEIIDCQQEYFNTYRNVIKHIETIKVNKKIKNKTRKQEFIDYIDSFSDKISHKTIPRIVAQYYIDYPQEHTPHNIKMKVYYVLSKYFPDEYKKLIIQQLNNELCLLNEK